MTEFNKRHVSEKSAESNIISDPLDALMRLAQDVEAVVAPRMNDTEHVNVLGFRPTSKAFLAKKGFLVQHTLGSGTYSKVKLALKYKGDQHGLKSTVPFRVAVKIIDTHRAPQDYQTKFMPRELSIWPKLRHPYIAPLLDLFRDGRFLYMVVPYAPGGDALTYIQDYGALNEGAAHRWMGQVVSAVLYMHKMGVTHRDLKLENLLIDTNGDLVLCDFGFVKGGCKEDADLSATFCGSKSYASPEILKGDLYDPCKADVWALGVILYIFVTGRMPFDEGRGTRAVLMEQKALRFRWATPHPISDICRELIMEAFMWDFNKRPSVQNMIDNTWFKTTGDTHIGQRETAMQTAWQNYHGSGDE